MKYFRVPVHNSNAYRSRGPEIVQVECKSGRIYVTDDQGHRFYKEPDIDKNGNPYLALHATFCDDFRLYMSKEAAEDYIRWFDTYRLLARCWDSRKLYNASRKTLEKVLQILKEGDEKCANLF